jgi:hypothetical protein
MRQGKNFRQFIEQEDNRRLYASMLPPEILSQRESLLKLVNAAYHNGDHETAERLDAELEELDEKIDSMLEDMDDGDAQEDKGEEQKDIDLDWSVQDEFARIYDQYMSGRLHLADEEWEEIDPSFRQDPEFQARMKRDSYALAPKGAYQQNPISKEKALADMLRGAIWDSPNLGSSRPRSDYIKSMTDSQIIDAAKDAWEWKKGLMTRIKSKK